MMRHKPASILAFLVLGILLVSWPSQPVSARLTESGAVKVPDAASRWVALPLMLDNIKVAAVEPPPPGNEVDPEIETATIAAQQAWHWHTPGEVQVPILMYHHVADFDEPFRYAVSLDAFEEQMQSLSTWGYTTIPISTLVEALTVGVALPERPLVITFDDGYMDVYENAFPIMQRFGFQGVAYIIVGQVEIGGFMHSEQLKELWAAGWEIGSHTYHHLDLRQADTNLQVEISDAREDLETLIGGPVDTFSFPYGLTTSYATSLVDQTGFQSAVGLGGFSRHTLATRLYLSRIEVQGEFDLETFASILPWVGPIRSNGSFIGLEE